MEYFTNTSSTTLTYPMTISSGTSGFFTTGTPELVRPRELAPLEWLDAEVERTCAAARQAA